MEPDDELDALFFGVGKATSLASRGKPNVSYAPDCVTSTKGAMYLQEVLSSHGLVASGASTKEGMYVDAGDWFICGVPALVCPDVVTTVGLGDTLTAGILYHELKMVEKSKSAFKSRNDVLHLQNREFLDSLI